jgi:hypothetical protein
MKLAGLAPNAWLAVVACLRDGGVVIIGGDVWEVGIQRPNLCRGRAACRSEPAPSLEVPALLPNMWPPSTTTTRNNSRAGSHYRPTHFSCLPTCTTLAPAQKPKLVPPWAMYKFKLPVPLANSSSTAVSAASTSALVFAIRSPQWVSQPVLRQTGQQEQGEALAFVSLSQTLPATTEAKAGKATKVKPTKDSIAPSL